MVGQEAGWVWLGPTEMASFRRRKQEATDFSAEVRQSHVDGEMVGLEYSWFGLG